MLNIETIRQTKPFNLSRCNFGNGELGHYYVSNDAINGKGLLIRTFECEKVEDIECYEISVSMPLDKDLVIRNGEVDSNSRNAISDVRKFNFKDLEKEFNWKEKDYFKDYQEFFNSLVRCKTVKEVKDLIQDSLKEEKVPFEIYLFFTTL